MNAPEQIPARRLDQLTFNHSFAALPPSFYTRLQPTPLPDPYLVCASEKAAALIGLDPAEFATKHFADVFCGNRTLENALPLAAVYSGHQFGVWAGQLGDGRAILLGEVDSPNTRPSGTLELQLKGAGLTPYSRMGDGRAVLRSSIREYLCSEAMAGLGIPTSRALCVIGSDAPVYRERPETAAVATRIAPTFIRFGSFEHWFYNQRPDELRTLADYVIDRFYPELRDAAQPYQALLREATKRTAHLIAQWQAVGFMHGVMNTDNMSILGITLDYGPYGFMEAFDVNRICNHSDANGRYSYGMQPRIAHWNCYALGQAMLPLIGEVDDVRAALDGYEQEYQTKFDILLHAKLGLRADQENDDQLIQAMFGLMQANHVDFTLFFRRLGNLRVDDKTGDEPLRDLFIDRAAFDAWAEQYRSRLRQENSIDQVRRTAMNAVNPQYVLRNYLAQIAIEKAQKKDFSEVDRLRKVLDAPYDEQPQSQQYAELPPDWASQIEVSCSS
ncbi:MAG: YdiU family protein [Burkholderiales bacterium]|nr:YdiU family protein [Burkholderiales bacterium]